MYYAIVDSESLKNPTVLNSYDQVNVSIQFEPHSDTNKYHHNFKIRLSDLEIHIERIQQEMKFGWYFFTWNSEVLYIIFDSKKFELILPLNMNTTNYREAQTFAKTQGIQEEYTNFIKYFLPFYTPNDFNDK